MLKRSITRSRRCPSGHSPPSLLLGMGALLLVMCLPSVVTAYDLEEGGGEDDRAVAGIVSNALACLAIDQDLPGRASGVVQLTWSGRVERARLVLAMAGTEATHTIRVNGWPAAVVPVHPDGDPCSASEYFYLDIPPQLLIQGDNLIEITDSAMPGDLWTAAEVRIEVLGDFALPSSDRTESTIETHDATALAQSTFIGTFVNAYDDSDQEFVAQIPDSYVPTAPTPLLIAVHPRSSAMEWGIDEFGAAANFRGWLLASPQMHGSWTGSPQPDPPGRYAYASLESQYDIIGTVKYMVQHYSVDTGRIYLAGYSMGGQGVAVTVAKYPHIFAAAFDNKGPTDMAEWYDEQVDYYGSSNADVVVAMRRECHIDEVPKTPSENPFCYQRRSGIRFAGNYLHIPISMTHSVSDLLVPIHHSRDLRDAINSYGPDYPASVYEEDGGDDGGSACGYHCYEPGPNDVLGFLEPFTLDSSPTHIRVTTDESKTYHWMSLTQTGGDHWSQVEVTSYPVMSTVTVAVSDTYPLDVALNLGSSSIMGLAGIAQPGMGLPATTYVVKGGGNHGLAVYTSGYLTVDVATTGQSMVTVSAITVQAFADPAVVSTAGTLSSSIQTVIVDHLGNSPPDGTSVEFSSSGGTFSNGLSTLSTSTVGGQATALFYPDPGIDLAVVTVEVGTVADSTTIQVLHPSLDVLVVPDQVTIYSGQDVTCTYYLTNTGDTELTGVSVVDDNGTPGQEGDDIAVCLGITLSPEEATTCSHTATRDHTTTSTATASGQDPLGGEVSDSDATTVTTISPDIALAFVPNRDLLYAGEEVTYTCYVTNTGDVVLTEVRVVDDNGTPGDEGDDTILCSEIILGPEGTTTCSHTATRDHTTTSTATATGQDPLGGDVFDSEVVTVTIISPAIALSVAPDKDTVYPGEEVIYTYYLTNTGDALLTGVGVVDDNGTPGNDNDGDDVTVCEQITLAPGAATSCSRSTTLDQTTTSISSVRGTDPLGNLVGDNDVTTVVVQRSLVYLPIVTSGN